MLKNNESDINDSSNYGLMTKKNNIHTCYKHTCVVSGCLDFCLSEGGGVYWQLSIIQPVSSQHPVNTAVIGMLETHTH